MKPVFLDQSVRFLGQIFPPPAPPPCPNPLPWGLMCVQLKPRLKYSLKRRSTQIKLNHSRRTRARRREEWRCPIRPPHSSGGEGDLSNLPGNPPHCSRPAALPPRLPDSGADLGRIRSGLALLLLLLLLLLCLGVPSPERS
ncbi:hypothetical protein VPH35_071982 [Triticum aestivum]